MVVDFRQAVLADQDLLDRWCAAPHVAAWWPVAPDLGDADFQSGRVRPWIVCFEEQSIGYLQDYKIHDWADHPYWHVLTGAVGIDQFIGDPAFLGRGLGKAMVAAAVERLIAEGVPLVVTDPDPQNARAIAVYEAAGFVSTGRTFETKDGVTLLMEARP